MLPQTIRRNTGRRLYRNGITKLSVGAIFVAIAVLIFIALITFLIVDIVRSEIDFSRQQARETAAAERDYHNAQASLKRLGINAELINHQADEAIITVGRCSRAYSISWDKDFKTPTFTRPLDDTTTLRISQNELLDDMPDTCQPTPG